jgi:hypothetical protein
MSNSASISAAKKRRGGMPPPMGGSGGGGGAVNLPPGLPPNFRQLPPQVQQQLFQQLQQRAAAANAQKAATPSQPQPPVGSMPPAPLQTRIPTPAGGGGGNNNTINVVGPYTVNPVIHNRAMAEVNGIHIRDLPISSAGLPCLPSGAALPPNVLFKLHHDELLNMDAILNEHSNKLQMLANRLDKGGSVSVINTSNTTDNGVDVSVSSYDKLVNNTDFITKILDNILTNTNLSDIINQIEPLQKENESLRSLLNSQQVTLNELSGLVMKLISNGLPSHNRDNGNSENYEGYEGYDSISNDIESSVYVSNENSNQKNNTDLVNNENDNGNVNGVCSISLDNIDEAVGGFGDEEEEGEEGEEGEDEEELGDEVVDGE